MRVLLDECVPRGLKFELSAHEVQTAPEAGWASKDDGQLRGLAKGSFDVLVTADKKLAIQQGARIKTIGVLVLRATRTSMRFLKPLAPKIRLALDKIQPGQVITIREQLPNHTLARFPTAGTGGGTTGRTSLSCFSPNLTLTKRETPGSCMVTP